MKKAVLAGTVLWLPKTKIELHNRSDEAMFRLHKDKLHAFSKAAFRSINHQGIGRSTDHIRGAYSRVIDNAMCSTSAEKMDSRVSLFAAELRNLYHHRSRHILEINIRMFRIPQCSP